MRCVSTLQPTIHVLSVFISPRSLVTSTLYRLRFVLYWGVVGVLNRLAYTSPDRPVTGLILSLCCTCTTSIELLVNANLPLPESRELGLSLPLIRSSRSGASSDTGESRSGSSEWLGQISGLLSFRASSSLSSSRPSIPPRL